jgi:serine/threonine protein kinase
MATVYLAHAERHRRSDALKVLLPDLAHALGPARFLREIEVAANLSHPHILPLFDSGEVEGRLYYVMPYVEGESLRDGASGAATSKLSRREAFEAGSIAALCTVAALTPCRPVP